MSESPLNLARALHAALEAGKHGAELRHLFHDDAYTLEHPNLINPRGGKSDLEGILRASQSGAGILQKQTYAVSSALEHGDTAIIRLLWSGVIARGLGAFQAGQVLTAHIAQFITARDGRIASIETYDCYEPFG